MIWVMIISLLVLMIIGVPIAFAMGAASLLYILVEGISLEIVTQRFFTSTQSFAFLAIPFFILMGCIMEHGGVAKRIINLANSLVRSLPGGLASVSVVTNMGMAGVSGSAAADAAAVGGVLMPEMKKKGYPASFSVALNASASVVGVIIPPSSVIIIIAWLSNLSVGEMFLAGAIPGILLSLAYLALTIVISIKRNYPREEKASWREIGKNLVNASLTIILPIFLVLSIVLGIATATEAAALAAVYAFVISFFIYRSLHLRQIFRALRDTVYTTTVVMFIVCSSMIFSWILINEGVPKLISDILLGFGLPNWALLLVIIFIMTLGGMFLDTVPNLFIFVPILYPITAEMGIDPMHFSIIMLCTLSIGLFTPPVGTSLFVSCRIANIRMEDTIKDLIPYFLVGTVMVIVVAFIPQLTLWLPNVLSK
ncbi:tripartite ATP-independent transporter DctM subunit [Pseudogracilibacillus auburnensis]|uniref:Tripartite ATP-independent transporter DctM subunit n=1 Tax=Pseudogracilibacillus auburnensis TaxID=1494959 RepID=A0A2V3VN96_9BACI|nr:TRAP transporter large permease [Pseudogracilibacillus auburnensis]PXW83323.1 tripartite ATP-independent transporter DctM subunit [Pseudogracilibacillus auburnensis]